VQKRDMGEMAGWIGSSDRPNGSITGVAVDSRAVKPGDLFFALQGERSDGHNFLEEAKRRGAVAAVVSRPIEAPLPTLRVADTLIALQEAASRYREKVCDAPIIAITGSVGKTTVKEFVSALLGTKYRLLATRGNRNSQVGTPLTLFELSGEEERVVLEMSLSGPGHIRRLVEIAPPDIAAITRVCLAHAEFFPDLEAIVRAKGEIFSHPQTALAFRPKELPQLCEIGSCPKAPFDLDFACEEGRLSLFREGELLVQCPWDLPGEHNRANFAKAAQIAHSAGMTWEEIAEAASHCALPPMRFSQLSRRGVQLIDDTYNACQASMEAALASMPQVAGKRIAVLGEMGELGHFSKQCHRAVGKAALERVDHLICFGKEALSMAEVWQEARREAKVFDDHAALLAHLREVAEEGDVVLIKGSRSCRLEQIVDQF